MFQHVAYDYCIVEHCQTSLPCLAEGVPGGGATKVGGGDKHHCPEQLQLHLLLAEARHGAACIL